MTTFVALILALPCWAAAAKPSPDAAALLRLAAQPEVKAYDGLMRVQTTLAGKESIRTLRLRFQSPASFRREILTEQGHVSWAAVSDGVHQWVYDQAGHKVWEGQATDADLKPLGLDDELELIEKNYALNLSSAAPVAGRSCWQLDLRSKADRLLRRRLWIDRRTGLILASAVYGPDETQLSMSRFEKISMSSRHARKAFIFAPPAGAAVLKRFEPDFMELDEAKSASGLEPQTPTWLPPGYVFESLDVLPRGDKRIIHYRFSDGVNVLSLFQCAPGVALDFGGKTASTLRVGGRAARLAWTAQGTALSFRRGKTRFLLVGLIGAQALRRVAESVQ